jgi:serine/threonine protein kinase
LGLKMGAFTQAYTIPPEYHGACSELVGQVLHGAKCGQWTVKQKLTRTSNSSGGTFSIGYIAVNEKGEEAFMKATDTNLLGGGNYDPLQALQNATKEHQFERDILDFCQGNNMDKIVVALDYGSMPIIYQNTKEFIFYIMFEKADGDSRSVIDKDKGYNFVWILHSLHNLAVAVRQLHSQRVAHNDIKPSNVLVFKELLQKLGDLGRATHESMSGPFDQELYPGDQTYAAPEQLYRVYNKHRFWGHKTHIDVRRASDLYLLGSMGYFFITGVPLTSKIQSVIHEEHLPIRWTGTYEEIIPYWREAFGKAMITFENNLIRTPLGKPTPLGLELADAVRYLCEPDPHKRGHPLNQRRGSDQYSVERFIGLFDKLRCKAQVVPG